MTKPPSSPRPSQSVPLNTSNPPPSTSTPITQPFSNTSSQPTPQHVPTPHPGQPTFALPFPYAPHPNSLPHQTFVPHLTYMEGQFATQALLVEQQRRIKTLEAELAQTQIEVMRLRSQVARQSDQPVQHLRLMAAAGLPPQMHLARDPTSGLHTQPGQIQITAHSGTIGAGVNGTGNRTAVAVIQSGSTPQPQEEQKKASSRYWTADEHNRFLEGLELFGQKDIKAISRHVGTRSATQVRTHAQKYYLRIERERIKAEQEGKQPPVVPGSVASKLANGKSSTNKGCHSQGKRSGIRVPNSTAEEDKRSKNSASMRNVASDKVESKAKPSTMKTPPFVNDKSTENGNAETAMTGTRAAKVEIQVENGLHETTNAVKTEIPKDPLHHTSNNFLNDHDMSSTNRSMPDASPNKKQSKGNAIPAPIACASQNTSGPATLLPSKTTHFSQNASVLNGNESEAGKVRPVKLEKRKGTEQCTHQVALAKESLPSPEQNTLPSEPARDTSGHETNERKLGVKQEAENDIEVEKELGKRLSSQISRRSPKKRLKRPANLAPIRPASCGFPSQESVPTGGILPRPNGSSQLGNASLKPPENKLYSNENCGSLTNIRALLRTTNEEQVAGSSGSKPPTLKRNESSNSVLADLSKNIGVLSRSNSFLAPSGKAVTRSNSILSLLSGLPTALRESPSTDRLLMMDGEDRVLNTLKGLDSGGSVQLGSHAGPSGIGQVSSAMGDRSFSFSQLQHIGLDELEDPNTVALALQEDQKWENG